MKIYADNAATTKLSKKALEAMLPFLTENYGNPSSLYTSGQLAREAVEKARETVARCIGASPREIYFTSGGSEADNQAILSAAELGKKAGKTHIVSDTIEHHAVLHTLKKLEKQGFEVTYLPAHENGIVRVEELEAALRDDTCLVTIMYANNEIGTLQPVREIGAVCRSRGILFHTDAVQAVGHVPVDVNLDNVDMLSASAHKFHGPKGVGFLYVRKGVKLLPFIEGGAQERGKRAGTENVAGICGAAVALEEAVENMAANALKLTALRDRLIKGLAEGFPPTSVSASKESRANRSSSCSTTAALRRLPALLVLPALSTRATCFSR